jgi:hypothetical protein
MPKDNFVDYESCISAKQACVNKVDSYQGFPNIGPQPETVKSEVLLFLTGLVCGAAIGFAVTGFH